MLPGSGKLSGAERGGTERRQERPPHPNTNANTQPRTRKHRLRPRLRRVLHLVIATLVLMLALEAVFFLLLAPRLHLTTVNVATDLALSDAEVLAMAGLTGDRSAP